MKEHLKDILEYSHHFNNRLIERFNDGDLHLAIPKNSIKLLSHILNAQAIWNQRMKSNTVDVDVWQVHSKDEMQNIEDSNYKETLDILEKMDLDKTIHYSNSKGEKFQNSVQEIMFHIVNHSTYHRGQIAAEMRKNGLEPIVSDYVFYKR